MKHVPLRVTSRAREAGNTLNEPYSIEQDPGLVRPCVLGDSPQMAQSFVHLLLTRFNTSIDFAPSGKRLETDWLNERLDLFERFCLPSVKAQRNAEFRWVIFFDEESPAWFKRKIELLRPLVFPIYIKGKATDEVLAASIVKNGLVTTPYLITTRLDNDDAIANTHMSLVQQAFEYQDREFIEFPIGLQSFRNSLYNVYWPSNPFLSLIENVQKGKPFTTVLSMPHYQVRRDCRVKSLIRSPQWLQVIHQSNVLNSLRGWPRISARCHQNFAVVWPEKGDCDSFLSRFAFFVNSFVARASKVFGKSGRSSERFN